MNSKQDTLIYIEEKDKAEAQIFSRCFADKNIRNRVYINILGAELAAKYLSGEGIAIPPVDNLHNIRKVLEELDISDVILPRTHIDVRMIFDEKFIFVPKSHFALNILPHIYFVFELAKDISHVKFLGFFKPDMIDLNKQNDQYYFIEKNQLISSEKLKDYLENAQTSTQTVLSDEELSNFNESIINMTDNDIDEMDKKIFLKVLTKSHELRNKFIEFENFELISYRAANEIELKNDDTEEKSEENFEPETLEVDDEFDIFENNDENSENLSQTEDVILSEIYDDIVGEDFIDNPTGDDNLD